MRAFPYVMGASLLLSVGQLDPFPYLSSSWKWQDLGLLVQGQSCSTVKDK